MTFAQAFKYEHSRTYQLLLYYTLVYRYVFAEFSEAVLKSPSLDVLALMRQALSGNDFWERFEQPPQPEPTGRPDRRSIPAIAISKLMGGDKS